MINLFNRFYSITFNRCFLFERLKLNSLARYSIRKLANWILPYFLNRTITQSICIDSNTKKQRILVSLTSFPKRISKLWMVIEILMRQTIKPDKVLLYLSNEQFPNGRQDLPDSLLRYEAGRLEIIFVDNDFRSHKKYYYAMRDYPNDLVITVDDDIFYPTTMIQTLVKYHDIYPQAVIARYARVLEWTENEEVKSSSCWKHLRKTRDVGDSCFFGTGGGTLFPAPANCLYKSVLDIDLARELCPLEDDLWLNTMVRLQHTQIIVVKDYKDILPIQNKGDVKLYSRNGGEDNMTDRQMNRVVSYYKTIGMTPYAKQ